MLTHNLFVSFEPKATKLVSFEKYFVLKCNSLIKSEKYKKTKKNC